MLDLSAVYFDGLRHALASADEIARRCVIGREPAKTVAKSLRLDQEQTEGVVRLMRVVRRLSPERAALVAMRDPGLGDADIAEMFGRSVRWASLVRSQAEEIRSEEPIPEHLEYLDSGLQPGDPMPAEIQARAAELRRLPGNRKDMRGGHALRAYSWTGYAFISIRAG